MSEENPNSPKALPQLVKPAEFALIKRVTRQTVATAMKSRIAAAIVIKDGRKLLDRELALELWNRNTIQNNHARIEAPTKAHASLEGPTTPSRVSDEQLRRVISQLPEDEIPELNESRARREHYLAEKARLDALEGRNELGSIEAMRREAFALAKTVREGMLAIIPRVSADLAALTDRFEIEQRLEEEVLIALRSLANG